jgi:small subunit ribosomal protein S33
MILVVDMTTQVVSNYAKRMARLSAKIFGEVSRPTPTKSLKVVKLFAEEPVYQKPSVVEYYPRHPEIGQLIRHVRFLGLYRLVIMLQFN